MKYTCIFLPSAASYEAWDVDARPDLDEIVEAVQRLIARARGRREKNVLNPKLQRMRATTEQPEGFRFPPHEGPPPLPAHWQPPAAAAPAEDEAEAPPALVSYAGSRLAVSTFIHHRVRHRNNRPGDRPGQFIQLGTLLAGGTRKRNQVLHALAPPVGWEEPDREEPDDPILCKVGCRCIALWHLRIGTAADNTANKRTDGPTRTAATPPGTL